jgi:hypothetical protein
VTTNKGDELFVYDIDARLVTYVQLPQQFDTWRAVETSTGTFIVCHQGRDTDPDGDAYHQVTHHFMLMLIVPSIVVIFEGEKPGSSCMSLGFCTGSRKNLMTRTLTVMITRSIDRY